MRGFGSHTLNSIFDVKNVGIIFSPWILQWQARSTSISVNRDASEKNARHRADWA